MAIRIILDIDVTNPEEVIKAHKGQIYGLLTDVVLSKEGRKRKVNQSLANQIVETLHLELPRELEKELVKADFRISVVRDVKLDEEID
ncbi:MAG: hypothetical protein ACI8Q1_001714 [Parvicella sp.]|jgi:hypothetical protein